MKRLDGAERRDKGVRLREEVPPRVCSVCGRSELETPFYKNRKITLCKEDFDKQNVAARKKSPERMRKISDYNNRWLKEHPEVAKKAVKTYLQKQKEERLKYRQKLADEGWLTLTQVGELLGISRQAASLHFLAGRLGEPMIDEHDTRVKYVKRSEVERFMSEREQARTASEVLGTESKSN